MNYNDYLTLVYSTPSPCSESYIPSSENNAPETSQAQVFPQHSPQTQAQNPQQVSTPEASPVPQQVSTLEASPAPQQVSTPEVSPAVQQVSTPEVSPTVQQVAANQVSPSSSNSLLPKLSLPTLNGNSLHWQTFWDSFDAAVP